jgi:hypothetical protein
MRNWKSTLSALLGAIWVAIQPIIDNGNFDFERDWRSLFGAAGLAGFGFLVKDAELFKTNNNEKNNTLAGRDTSIGEGGSSQGVEDNN